MLVQKRQDWIYLTIIAVAISLFFACATRAHAAYATQLPVCSAESTGLKYVNKEGSGFASMFFIIPLLALAPVAGTLGSNSQYGCHVAVIGSDAVGAYRKIYNRKKVTPY